MSKRFIVSPSIIIIHFWELPGCVIGEQKQNVNVLKSGPVNPWCPLKDAYSTIIMIRIWWNAVKDDLARDCFGVKVSSVLLKASPPAKKCQVFPIDVVYANLIDVVAQLTTTEPITKKTPKTRNRHVRSWIHRRRSWKSRKKSVFPDY